MVLHRWVTIKLVKTVAFPLKIFTLNRNLCSCRSSLSSHSGIRVGFTHGISSFVKSRKFQSVSRLRLSPLGRMLLLLFISLEFGGKWLSNIQRLRRYRRIILISISIDVTAGQAANKRASVGRRSAVAQPSCCSDNATQGSATALERASHPARLISCSLPAAVGGSVVCLT